MFRMFSQVLAGRVLKTHPKMEQNESEASFSQKIWVKLHLWAMLLLFMFPPGAGWA
jgi:hypothetical protein